MTFFPAYGEVSVVPCSWAMVTVSAGVPGAGVPPSPGSVGSVGSVGAVVSPAAFRGVSVVVTEKSAPLTSVSVVPWRTRPFGTELSPVTVRTADSNVFEAP
ncbi:hypothetical protein ACL00T_16355 [Curtobacterium flaccumfaciens]